VTIIADTGWIVGFLDRRDAYHTWARETAETSASASLRPE